MSDKYYNVWRDHYGTWSDRDEVWDSATRKPKPLSYPEARRTLEEIRAEGRKDAWVREIAADGLSTSSLPVGFNVWMEDDQRWTNASPSRADIGTPELTTQNAKNPHPLTYTQAVKFQDYISMTTKVMEIGADLSPQPVFQIPGEKGAAPVAQPVVAAPTPVPVEPPFDYDRYNGANGLPSYMVSMRPTQLERANRDPYSGLPKKLKEDKS